MRPGIIAKKIGMSNFYTPNGLNIPVTILHVDDCKVIERTEKPELDTDKILLGACEIKKENKTNKATKGFFKKKSSVPFKYIREFSIDKETEVKAGDSLKVDHFQEGQFIDVSGFSKGKGFAGAMKRHNFGGMRATHGVSISHRAHGSTGQCQDPGKVFKGKKMAGHLGDEHKTLQSLQVVKVDTKNNIICVKGSTPGARGAWLVVEDSIKQKSVKDFDIKIPVESKKKK
ncbi:MAG: 50S ribosomal protein L3 [Pelagibacteraceae bacterium TMED258]|nr:MAG: 50S ribosomal protein L3 [Pelagibacteraceae bacterium TMED258]